MKIKIRQANIQDIKEIYKLGSKLEDALKASKKKNAHFHEKSEFKEFIKNKKENILLVAEINKQLVGFIYAKIISKDWCMIDNLAVNNEYQNQGRGTQLLNETYNILKSKKITYVQIIEEIHHKKTRKFWHDKGFKEEKIFIWADKNLK